MMGQSSDTSTRLRWGYRATLMLSFFCAMILFLEGCAVDDISVVSYTSSAEVKPSESQPRLGGVGSSPFPWDIVLSGASDILTGARKKAIEENVGYRESRSFTLFRLKRADSSSQSCNERSDQRSEHPSQEQGK